MENVFREKYTTIYDNHYKIPLIHQSDKFGVVLFPVDSTPWDSQTNQENAQLIP